MTPNKKPLIIGLTGSSGSGKGAVGKILTEKGCLVIDCDKIAHENMEKGGTAYDDIVSAFGNGILRSDGEIDRKILGNIVFNDSTELELLNKLTHRRISDRIEKIIRENTQYDIIVIDAPLLKESGIISLCDTVWLVKADKEVRLKRVMRRDGIDRRRAEERFANQTPFDESEADIITENNTDSEAELKTDVERDAKALFGGVRS